MITINFALLLNSFENIIVSQNTTPEELHENIKFQNLLCQISLLDSIDDSKKINDVIAEFERICMNTNMRTRKYVMIRMCHCLFKDINFKLNGYIPMPLKRIFGLCSGGERGEYHITCLIGLGYFLAYAAMVGESRFVEILLFDSQYNYIETMSELDIVILYQSILRFLSKINVTMGGESIMLNEPYDVNFINHCKINVAMFTSDKNSAEKRIDLYRLAHSLFSSKKFLLCINKINESGFLNRSAGLKRFFKFCNGMWHYNYFFYAFLLFRWVERPEECIAPSVPMDYSRKLLINSSVGIPVSRINSSEVQAYLENLCNEKITPIELFGLFSIHSGYKLVVEAGIPVLLDAMKNHLPSGTNEYNDVDFISQKDQVLCMTELHESSYIDLKNDDDDVSRFFNISSQLPIEMKMHLINMMDGTKSKFTNNLFKDSFMILVNYF